MGKTLGRDLDLGKMTLPLIHYLGQADPAGRERVMAASRHGSPEARAQIASAVNEAGSISYAMTTAETYVRKALADLEALPLSPARASMTALAEFILRRDL
jgi:geranylgeranyl pyrophosphate synthase